jgi:prepilin peptidase CpaA
MIWITVIATVAILATTLLACVSDARSLKIPNLYSVIIIALFPAAFLATPELFGKWWEHLGSLGAIFVITYLMFAAGMMGGGDTKLGTALALWVGLPAVLPYVIWMGAAGGIVALLSLYFKKKKPFKSPRAGSWPAQVQEGRNAVPYGIAISFGAWAALLQKGFMPDLLHEVSKIIH